MIRGRPWTKVGSFWWLDPYPRYFNKRQAASLNNAEVGGWEGARTHHIGHWVHQSCHLCYELFMRLSYYVHLRYGKMLTFTWGSNSGPSNFETSTLPLDQSAYTVWFDLYILLYIMLVLVNIIFLRGISIEIKCVRTLVTNPGVNTMKHFLRKNAKFLRKIEKN